MIIYIIVLKLQDMLFDFMKQISSRLERIEEKGWQRELELAEASKKVEKRKACISCFNIIFISQPKKTEALY